MPRTPGPGSQPPTTLVREVTPLEFTSTQESRDPWSAVGSWPLASGASLQSAYFDVLTPAYQGRPLSGVLGGIFEATQGLGVPGTGTLAGPTRELRVPAVYLDATCFTSVLVSIQFQFVYSWTAPNTPRQGTAYRWLPVLGGVSPANEPRVCELQGYRIPSPWIGFALTNESANPINQADVLLHVVLRGG